MEDTATSDARPVDLPPSLAVRVMLAGVSLVLAALVWLPSVHFFFQAPVPPPKQQAAVVPWADRLAARHLHLWSDAHARHAELAKTRSGNAEWDFMGRSFLVWALGNMALGEPDRQDEYLAVMDRIIDETLRLERQNGMHHFLMPYAWCGSFVQQPPRSLFLDGEIALMLAVRQVVRHKDAYCQPLRDRVDTILQRMEAGPVLCAESYPDECWTFCNAVALAAVRLDDYLVGTDHSDFFQRWVHSARQKLVDPDTGLLVSSFTLAGQPMDGPEGSSIWMVAHCLQVIDEDFARDQYDRARQELGRKICGFGYAREWPPGWQGRDDVDSGPVIPVLGVSAGSSGLALVGARAFDDGPYFRSLRTTLDFAAFPIERRGRLRYGASNQVGDAVLLYAAVMGPVWEEVQRREESRP